MDETQQNLEVIYYFANETYLKILELREQTCTSLMW